MCNLYHMSPREHVERYFRLMLPADYRDIAVGPFNTGLFLRQAPGSDDATSSAPLHGVMDPTPLHGAMGPTPLRGVMGQWGLIAPGSAARRPASRAILTNNARAESIAARPTYRDAWRQGQRCLIPAAWYQEPNWETGRNIWWRMQRRDGEPWALAGLWSEWTDPSSGEIVPSYTMITINCDGHPLLGRLHKPDPQLPPDQQDKRSVVPLAPSDWHSWLRGSETQARALLTVPDTDLFDPGVTQATDDALRRREGQGGLF